MVSVDRTVSGLTPVVRFFLQARQRTLEKKVLFLGEWWVTSLASGKSLLWAHLRVQREPGTVVTDTSSSFSVSKDAPSGRSEHTVSVGATPCRFFSPPTYTRVSPPKVLVPRPSLPSAKGRTVDPRVFDGGSTRDVYVTWVEGSLDVPTKTTLTPNFLSV